ncbi:MAG: hypothetical protein AAFX06_12870 [Planctomycetota bacterium]
MNVSNEGPDPYRSPAEIGEVTAAAPAKSKLTLIVFGVLFVLGGLGLGAVLTLKREVQEFGEIRRGPPISKDVEIKEELPPSTAPLSDEGN